VWRQPARLLGFRCVAALPKPGGLSPHPAYSSLATHPFGLSGR
jgi:hypothetical protein